jgi:hypothetical protein
MYTNSYHNTTNEPLQLQIQFEQISIDQEKEILRFFYAKKQLTASECYQLYGKPEVPLTSIRRAITNLKNKGNLIITNIKKIGFYGRPESVYQLI